MTCRLEFKVRCRLEFKVNDCWVGWFWRVGPPARIWAPGDVSGAVDPTARRRRVDVWVCLVPMFPIHFTWYLEATAVPSGGSPR
jgi:hypothetical protein